ncbi:MAG: hypothetical protein HKN14_14620 [Marinicaulis sp.]|nr:DUF2807 domain-containing protein [Marinicaulis sp.]NNE42141.1 hypothetical protein [Marinicaulis sp.]NNL88739.1 hypothetical protein [Marinicaulis sp.]
MKSQITAVSLAALIAISGQALAGDERRFDLPDFDRIDLSSGVVLIADVGEAQSVLVKTDHGDFSDFKIEVDNGELNVTRKWNRLSWHQNKSDYKVLVTVPNLKGLEASSGSHAKVSNLDAESFFIDLSSGAHASLEGNCDNCSLDLSSGANLHAKNLECDAAEIDVSSGGFGELKVLSSVNADASSGGKVVVYGSPAIRSVDKSSGGRIKFVSAAQASRD